MVIKFMYEFNSLPFVGQVRFSNNAELEGALALSFFLGHAGVIFS